MINRTLLVAGAVVASACLFSQRVVPVGEGATGPEVNAMVEYNGQLVLGGFFSAFNTVADRNLQGWDGVNHDPLGTEFATTMDRVEALLVLGSDLIAGGREPSLGHIARWDGAVWSDMDGGMDGHVLSLVTFGGELHAGGMFTTAGGSPCARVAKWTGMDWTPLGAGLNGDVLALAVYNGALYAGGDFTADSNGNPLHHLAKWNGTAWLPAGSGVNDAVAALAEHDGELYLAGSFTSDMDSTVMSKGVMSWDNSSFSAFPVQFENSVRSLCAHPSVGLCVGLQDRSHAYLNGQLTDLRFAQPKGILAFNNARFICGSGSSGSYDVVRGIGRLLPGSDLEHVTLNKIRAGKSAWGAHFYDLDLPNSLFQAPRDSSTTTIFRISMALAGRSNGALVGTSIDFGMNAPCDAGPHASVNDSVFYNRYFQVWGIRQDEIDHHTAHWQDPGYEIPYTISSWPGNGDLNNGEAAQLAPFTDINNNGFYEPDQGDAPLVRGDMAIYSISHQATGSTGAVLPSIPMDIHNLWYAFGNSWDAFLDNTIFLNVKFVNRGSSAIDSTLVGAWTDFDIGGIGDDYVGCDTALSSFFGYNADPFDANGPGGSNGYFDLPPAQSITYLNQSLTAHSTPFSFGQDTLALYNMLSGKWSNGSPIVTPGGDTMTFAYPGDPSNPLEWHEAYSGNAPGDRLSIGSVGPFFFSPGDTICLDMALVFAQDPGGDNLGSVALLKQRIAEVRNWYSQQAVDCNGTYGLVTAEQNLAHEPPLNYMSVFPNPTTGAFTVLSSAQDPGPIRLLDISGQCVREYPWSKGAGQQTLSTTGLPPGLYLVQFAHARHIGAARLIVQEH